MTWSDLTQIVEQNHSFLICAHENPDGDSIGSQLAFYKYLKNLGKETVICNKDKTPKKLSFLPNSDTISNKLPKKKFDVLLILDCSNQHRPNIENLTSFAPKLVNIDHHRDNKSYGDLNFVDGNSAATCLILYEYFKQTDVNIDADRANCLLAGILTDTGRFEFNNADGSLYLVANDLVKFGADNGKLFKKIYAESSPADLKVRAKVWGTLEFFANGKISVISMHKKLITDLGADTSATEGLSNEVMGCEGVEVGIFAKYDKQEVRFSLRSAGKIDVGEIAAEYPVGGGHKFAAGCTAKKVGLREAIDAIVDKISLRFPAIS
ncbi:MAG: bifunctional oligoribonuclease/PAP phosphatase NrnA [Chitinivibrionia bacterium]|nr:bifunctional oligoribonuclease/PAP phosphatase NrnA [Chitinivibrionia bacterium]